MSSFGVIDTGFNTKLLEDIKTSIEEEQLTTISPGLNQSSTSVLGQLNGIFAAKNAELWEVLAEVYGSIDPASASGDALDNVCALVGVVRLAATATTVTLTMTGDPTTVLPIGRVASVNANASARFDTLAAATITALSAWGSATGYVVGNRVTHASRVYGCITAGTSAGSGGPTSQLSDITDGTVHWRYIGEGTAAVDVAASCETTGPLDASSGTVTVIETPVTGWSSVTNLLDGIMGRNRETDAALRVRRETELTVTGAATVDAIRADLLAVADVTQAFVFANNTDTTDGDGVPPHAIEALAQGGDDDALAQALWNSVAAGIQTYGGSSGTATDITGATHTVAFSRPTEVDIYHDIQIHTDSHYPSDGDAQVKAAVAAYGQTLQVGQDVVSSAQYAAVFSISGVIDVAAINQDIAPAPTTNTTLDITSRQLASFDTSRMTVTIL